MNIRFVFVLLSILGLSTTCLFSQDQLPTQSISIFKNGSAFYYKKGTINTPNQRYYLEEDAFPEALFGTFWIQSPDRSILSIQQFNDTLRKEKKISSKFNLLVENKNKKVSLKIDDQIIVGELAEVLPNIVTIKTASGWLSTNPASIDQIMFEEKPQNMIESKEVEKKLEVRFLNKANRQELEMMYLQKGLGWLPTYLIELGEDSMAWISLQAEVINDVEDIKNTDVNFVVGVPNFSFANQLAPLVGDQQLDRILRVLGVETNPMASFSNSIQNQSISYGIDRNLSLPPVPAETGLAGQASEDLFFYTLEDLSLPKGGRGRYTIFRSEVPVSHIYETQLPANSSNYSYFSRASQDQQAQEVVHMLKVNNTTQNPFTTGPAMVIDRRNEVPKPTSQDKLKYIPPGGHTFLKITTAPDIAVVYKEEVVSTTENAYRKNKTTYDLITVKASTNVKNYKGKDIDMNIRRTISGKLGSSKPDWLKSERVNPNNNINPITDVCWEVSIKAGKELTIKYEYEMYVPRR